MRGLLARMVSVCSHVCKLGAGVSAAAYRAAFLDRFGVDPPRAGRPRR